MTDSEWIANIHNVSNAEIFEQLEQIGCDGYYRDIWSACIEELQRRVNLTSGDLISREWVIHNVLSLIDPETRFYVKQVIDNAPPAPERPKGEWVRKEDVIHSIAKQYSEHNELVPIWLSIGDLNGGTDKGDN